MTRPFLLQAEQFRNGRRGQLRCEGAIVAVLASEAALVPSPLTVRTIRRLGRLDAGHGASAGLILVVGFLRVFCGAKAPEFFLANPVFWGKIAAFAAVWS